MRLFGRDVLTHAGARNRPVRAWLAVWIENVEGSEWHGIADVRVTYPAADGVRLASGTVVTVFNVQGNHYRLLTWINFELQSVEALAVLTHAEYDKDLWKAWY